MTLGLPNYLLYDQQESAAIAALTGAIFAITYAFVSLYIQKWSDKIGKIVSLQWAIWINALVPFLYLLPYNLSVLYIIRVIDGGSCGWFWTLLEANLSNLGSQNLTINRKIAHYNLAWNLGGIIGYLIGALVIFYVVNNEIVFPINVGLSLPMLLSIWLIRHTQKNDSGAKQKQISIQESSDLTATEHNLNLKQNSKDSQNHLTSYSIVIPILFVALFSTSFGTLPILISTKLEYFAIAAYNTYVFAFVRSIASTIGSRVFDQITESKMMALAMWSGVILAVISFIFGLFLDIWLYIVLNAVFGLCSMFIYAMGLKIILELNRANNTVKYSSWFQCINGIISGVLPFLAGLGAAFSIDAMFWACGLFGLFLVGIIQIKLVRRKKETY